MISMIRLVVMVALLLGGAFSFTQCVYAAESDAAEEYYSETVSYDASGKMISHSRLWSKGDIYRSEDTLKQGQTPLITIYRPDKKVMWTFIGSKYCEEPVDLEKVLADFKGSSKPEIVREPIGTEVVNGVTANKVRQTVTSYFKDLNGNQQKSVSHYLYWMDAKTEATLKSIDLDNNIVVVYLNYKAGPFDPSIYELPANVAGYTKCSSADLYSDYSPSFLDVLLEGALNVPVLLKDMQDQINTYRNITILSR